MWARAETEAPTADPEVPVTVITNEGVASGVLVGNTIRVPSSWAPEVLTEGEWCGNGMRFRTRNESDLWGRALLSRWMVPVDSRSVESDDPPNYEIVDGVLRR